MVDDTGTDTITGLAPGRYFLSARGYSSDRLSVAYDVVDFVGDSQEALLYLQPAARIAGRIIGDRGEKPSLDGVRVGAAWLHDDIEVNPLSVDEAAVAADGTFHSTASSACVSCGCSVSTQHSKFDRFPRAAST